MPKRRDWGACGDEKLKTLLFLSLNSCKSMDYLCGNYKARGDNNAWKCFICPVHKRKPILWKKSLEKHLTAHIKSGDYKFLMNEQQEQQHKPIQEEPENEEDKKMINDSNNSNSNNNNTNSMAELAESMKQMKEMIAQLVSAISKNNNNNNNVDEEKIQQQQQVVSSFDCCTSSSSIITHTSPPPPPTATSPLPSPVHNWLVTPTPSESPEPHTTNKSSGKGLSKSVSKSVSKSASRSVSKSASRSTSGNRFSSATEFRTFDYRKSGDLVLQLDIIRALADNVHMNAEELRAKMNAPKYDIYKQKIERGEVFEEAVAYCIARGLTKKGRRPPSLVLWRKDGLMTLLEGMETNHNITHEQCQLIKKYFLLE